MPIAAKAAAVVAALDGYVFVSLAFGSLTFFAGQFIGKSEMIAVGTALTLARRRLLPIAA